MLNAVVFANRQSSAAARVQCSDIPATWLYEPAELQPDLIRDADLLAIVGGDGTVQKTISQLLRQMTPEELPPVAVLPYGTTNMTSLDLNTSRTRRGVLKKLNECINTKSVPTQDRAMVRIEAADDIHHGFFFGMGVIATLVEDWNDKRAEAAISNQLRSVWAFLNGLRSTTSSTDIELDHESMSVYGLLATTMNRLLFGARPFWGPRAANQLKVTWVASGTPGLLRHAPALLRGSAALEKQPGFESTCRESFSLRLQGPYVLDGELFHSDGGTLNIQHSAPLRWAVL